MSTQARPRRRPKIHPTPGPGRRHRTARKNGSLNELPRAAMQSMARELRRQVRHLNRCIRLLPYVDLRTYEAGRLLFVSDAGLALWLCDPMPLFQGMVPLFRMRTAKGRRAISNLLRTMVHGIPV